MNLNDQIAAVIDKLARAVHPHLHRRGAIWRLLRALRARLPRQKPQHRSGKIINAFAADFPHACFIQIGANDGAQHDPLRTTILKQRWHGVLVEPVPFVFDRLQLYYQGFKRVKLENVAIADHDGIKDFYHLRQAKQEDDLPRWYDGIGSFNRDVVLKHRDRIPDIDQRIVTRQVPCLKFSSLCERHGIEVLDLLQMDTEGYDFEIIRRIDLNRFRPILIMYEHHHLSSADKRACEAYLESAGFNLVHDGLDTLGLHQDAKKRGAHQLIRIWNEALRTETIR